ncbi:MAG TPA: TonB-dependent receptor [Rhodanobacteraceae bacterium]|nr:TonB-dependent receptor [Rhodanobacteraceae bacterium]
MTLRACELSSAVRLALSLGLVGLDAGAATVPAETAAGTGDSSGELLETIVVTGSNVRRVDTETANPVITIDRAAIQQSGKLTLGDIVQDLPVVTGPYTNPRVNNGGGTGASTVSLRGLGSQRTLILVNGHRYLYGDVNAIPAAAVERIEVLTDGASSVYGSDAEAGVVNFILRSNYQGAEFSADYGISDRDDGERMGYHFIFGQTTDKGSILAGVDYNRFEPVLASNREFSKNAIYYYYGTAHLAAGSSRTPTGRVDLPPALRSQFGCRYVTLKTLGQISNPPRLDDFRCYVDATDSYNYQGHGNLELTPQERSTAFIVGNYKLGDHVEAYLEYFHNKTQSASQVAPLPIDTGGSRLAISAQSYYNPFGVDFSNDSRDFRTRAVGNGNRIGNYSTQNDQATAGFRGSVADTSWQWNAYFNYSHLAQLNHTSGYIDVSKLSPGLGPSYKDASGHVVCGTDPATGGTGPIGGCTPYDLFDITDPVTVAQLNNFSGNSFTNVVYTEHSVVAEANGGLLDLPAGTTQLALGVSYRKQFGQTIPDAFQVPDDAGICDIGTGCVAPIRGGFDVKEAYAELLIPILKDLPLASALNLTIGDRYSKYSNFGNTNNTKFAIEYRPIEDLLLRGTVSEVFRAPTITDLYQGNLQTGGAAATDPCFGLVGTNAACVGVPGDGSLQKDEDQGRGNFVNANTAGAITAGSPIGPEHGKSFDWGFVYDPHWLPGLSISVDLWRIYLINDIGQVGAQSVLDQCYLANGGPYCHLIHRYPAGSSQGQIQFVVQPAGNLGRVDAKGADVSARYRLSQTRLGNFALNFQASYLDRFADDPTPGLPGDITQEYAGHYTNGASAISGVNYSRWKALSTLSWNLGAWSAGWTLRYVGKYTVGYARLDYDASACASNSPPGCELKYGASVYHNVTAGYAIETLNTRIDIGIDNLGDKPPALIYNNNTRNGNVDPNTFDTIGRFYWARVTVKF